MSAPSLDVLAIQARQIRQQVESLRFAARDHGLTLDASHDTEALCVSVETLMGMVWAGFHNANAKRHGCKCHACGNTPAAVAADPRS